MRHLSRRAQQGPPSSAGFSCQKFRTGCAAVLFIYFWPSVMRGTCRKWAQLLEARRGFQLFGWAGKSGTKLSSGHAYVALTRAGNREHCLSEGEDATTHRPAGCTASSLGKTQASEWFLEVSEPQPNNVVVGNHRRMRTQLMVQIKKYQL